jgi:hypothetical protein
VPADARELNTIDTAERLKAIGYSSNFDPVMLYPEVYTRQSTMRTPPPLKEVLSNTVNKLQEARTRATGLDELLKLAIESLEICVDMRKADQADALIRYLNDEVGWPVLSTPI